MSRTVIVEGSHRAGGNTTKIAQRLANLMGADLISLFDYNVGYYEYDFSNKDDDFLPLIRRIAADYDTIILGTPVYWYSISGRLKNFMDRLSDGLRYDKTIGRSLANKRLAAFCCGTDSEEFLGYFEPFRLSAAYLDMNYVGNVHTWLTTEDISDEVDKRLQDFVLRLTA